MNQELTMIKYIDDNKLIASIPVSAENVFTEQQTLALIFETQPNLTGAVEIIFKDYDFFPVQTTCGKTYFIYSTTKIEIENYVRDNCLFKDKELNKGGEYE